MIGFSIASFYLFAGILYLFRPFLDQSAVDRLFFLPKAAKKEAAAEASSRPQKFASLLIESNDSRGEVTDALQAFRGVALSETDTPDASSTLPESAPTEAAGANAINPSLPILKGTNDCVRDAVNAKFALPNDVFNPDADYSAAPIDPFQIDIDAEEAADACLDDSDLTEFLNSADLSDSSTSSDSSEVKVPTTNFEGDDELGGESHAEADVELEAWANAVSDEEFSPLDGQPDNYSNSDSGSKSGFESHSDFVPDSDSFGFCASGFLDFGQVDREWLQSAAAPAGLAFASAAAVALITALAFRCCFGRRKSGPPHITLNSPSQTTAQIFKSVLKPELKPDLKSDLKSDLKTDLKTDNKSDFKSELKSELKSDVTQHLGLTVTSDFGHTPPVAQALRTDEKTSESAIAPLPPIDHQSLFAPQPLIAPPPLDTPQPLSTDAAPEPSISSLPIEGAVLEQILKAVLADVEKHLEAKWQAAFEAAVERVSAAIAAQLEVNLEAACETAIQRMSDFVEQKCSTQVHPQEIHSQEIHLQQVETRVDTNAAKDEILIGGVSGSTFSPQWDSPPDHFASRSCPEGDRTSSHFTSSLDLYKSHTAEELPAPDIVNSPPGAARDIPATDDLAANRVHSQKRISSRVENLSDLERSYKLLSAVNSSLKPVSESQCVIPGYRTRNKSSFLNSIYAQDLWELGASLTSQQTLDIVAAIRAQSRSADAFATSQSRASHTDFNSHVRAAEPDLYGITAETRAKDYPSETLTYGITAETHAKDCTSDTHTYGITAETHAKDCTSDKHTYGITAGTRTNDCTSDTHTYGIAAETRANDCTSELHTYEQHNKQRTHDGTYKPNDFEQVNEPNTYEKTDEPLTYVTRTEQHTLGTSLEPKTHEQSNKLQGYDSTDEPQKYKRNDEPHSLDRSVTSHRIERLPQPKTRGRTLEPPTNGRTFERRSFERIGEPKRNGPSDAPHTNARTSGPHTLTHAAEPHTTRLPDERRSFAKAVEPKTRACTPQLITEGGKVQQQSCERVVEPQALQRNAESYTHGRLIKPQTDERIAQPHTYARTSEPHTQAHTVERHSSERAVEPRIHGGADEPHTDARSNKPHRIEPHRIEQQSIEPHTYDRILEPKESERIDKPDSREQRGEPRTQDRSTTTSHTDGRISEHHKFGEPLETDRQSQRQQPGPRTTSPAGPLQPRLQVHRLLDCDGKRDFKDTNKNEDAKSCEKKEIVAKAWDESLAAKLPGAKRAQRSASSNVDKEGVQSKGPSECVEEGNEGHSSDGFRNPPREISAERLFDVPTPSYRPPPAKEPTLEACPKTSIARPQPSQPLSPSSTQSQMYVPNPSESKSESKPTSKPESKSEIQSELKSEPKSGPLQIPCFDTYNAQELKDFEDEPRTPILTLRSGIRPTPVTEPAPMEVQSAASESAKTMWNSKAAQTLPSFAPFSTAPTSQSKAQPPQHALSITLSAEAPPSMTLDSVASIAQAPHSSAPIAQAPKAVSPAARAPTPMASHSASSHAEASPLLASSSETHSSVALDSVTSRSEAPPLLAPVAQAPGTTAPSRISAVPALEAPLSLAPPLMDPIAEASSSQTLTLTNALASIAPPAEVPSTTAAHAVTAHIEAPPAPPATARSPDAAPLMTLDTVPSPVTSSEAPPLMVPDTQAPLQQAPLQQAPLQEAPLQHALLQQALLPQAPRPTAASAPQPRRPPALRSPPPLPMSPPTMGPLTKAPLRKARQGQRLSPVQRLALQARLQAINARPLWTETEGSLPATKTSSKRRIKWRDESTSQPLAEVNILSPEPATTAIAAAEPGDEATPAQPPLPKPPAMQNYLLRNAVASPAQVPAPLPLPDDNRRIDSPYDEDTTPPEKRPELAWLYDEPSSPASGSMTAASTPAYQQRQKQEDWHNPGLAAPQTPFVPQPLAQPAEQTQSTPWTPSMVPPHLQSVYQSQPQSQLESQLQYEPQYQQPDSGSLYPYGVQDAQVPSDGGWQAQNSVDRPGTVGALSVAPRRSTSDYVLQAWREPEPLEPLPDRAMLARIGASNPFDIPPPPLEALGHGLPPASSFVEAANRRPGMLQRPAFSAVQGILAGSPAEQPSFHPPAPTRPAAQPARRSLSQRLPSFRFSLPSVLRIERDPLGAGMPRSANNSKTRRFADSLVNFLDPPPKTSSYAR